MEYSSHLFWNPQNSHLGIPNGFQLTIVLIMDKNARFERLCLRLFI
jgi:hypothetical protein